MKLNLEELTKGLGIRRAENVPGDKTTLTKEERAAKDLERRRKKRDEKKVTLVNFTYDPAQDCYIWNEKTAQMKDVPDQAVHMTGKRHHYFMTDIWDDLVWPHENQSAIHMYLWMINTKINPEAITEKGKHDDIDMKKLIMYGAIGIVVLLVAWQFIPR